MSQTKQLTEIQERWLQALESGDYKQGQGRLRWGDQYCCLGVACAVAGYQFTAIGNAYAVDGDQYVLPRQAWNDLGLRGPLGELYNTLYWVNGEWTVESDGTSGVHTLAAMNDAMSFAEIAHFIREHPAEVFA